MGGGGGRRRGRRPREAQLLASPLLCGLATFQGDSCHLKPSHRSPPWASRLPLLSFHAGCRSKPHESGQPAPRHTPHSLLPAPPSFGASPSLTSSPSAATLSASSPGTLCRALRSGPPSYSSRRAASARALPVPAPLLTGSTLAASTPPASASPELRIGSVTLSVIRIPGAGAGVV